jgi:allantoin racemase
MAKADHMLIQIINGNTTTTMTDLIAARGRAVASVGTEIRGVTPESGPASVEGFYDGALAVPGILRAIAKGEAEGVDAHVIACFDDPGLDAARSVAKAPVIGICEAAFAVARMIATGVSVITDLSVSVPPLERLVRHYGAVDLCRRIRVAAVPVLELAAAPDRAEQAVGAEIERALQEDRADAIILGCASLCGLTQGLSARFGVPIIEGVGAAVKLAEALVGLKAATAKTGGYAVRNPSLALEA